MISFDFHGIEEAVKLKNTLFLAKDFELFYSSKRIDYQVTVCLEQAIMVLLMNRNSISSLNILDSYTFSITWIIRQLINIQLVVQEPAPYPGPYKEHNNELLYKIFDTPRVGIKQRRHHKVIILILKRLQQAVLSFYILVIILHASIQVS